jgi:hypothetical protein
MTLTQTVGLVLLLWSGSVGVFAVASGNPPWRWFR